MKKRILTLCIIISMTIALANATEIGQFIANMVPYKIMIDGVEERFEKPVVNMNTPPETVHVDRTNGATKPLKWCMVTAAMVH